MRRTILAAATGVLLAPALGLAQDSPHTLTGNVGLYSQYIFRGLAQTNEEPALQGGFDYSHASGFYLGTWGSNVSWLRDGGTYNGGGSLELDFYGGFKNQIGNTGIGYDVGLLYYWYPGDQITTTPVATPDADTLELYLGGSWKWFSVKYSYSLNDETFGVLDSDGTWYLDLGVTYPVGDTGITLGAHWGTQKFEGRDPRNVGGASNDDLYSYDDWRISVAYDLGKASKMLSGAEIGMMYTDTDGANACGYGSINSAGTAAGVACTGVYPKDLADSQFTVWFKKTF